PREQPAGGETLLRAPAGGGLGGPAGVQNQWGPSSRPAAKPSIRLPLTQVPAPGGGRPAASEAAPPAGAEAGFFPRGAGSVYNDQGRPAGEPALSRRGRQEGSRPQIRRSYNKLAP